MQGHHLPADIERSSLAIIRSELAQRGIALSPETEAVVLRCIHVTADFDYSANLYFSTGAVSRAVLALKNGAEIVTDTNMALSGISVPALGKLGSAVHCFMSEPDIAEKAVLNGTTRAVASMDSAAERFPFAIRAVGNAPTALFRIAEQIKDGLRPSLIVAAPVGFVNVVEAKERIVSVCGEYDIPCIAAMGRKGGSTVAAAICNALLYTAAEMLDPTSRGWN